MNVIFLCHWILVLPTLNSAYFSPLKPLRRRKRNLMLSSDLHPWIVSSLNEEGKEQSISAPNAKFPTRLILHFDINETILLGDDAGGDSRHDSVQKMLAKSAFCQMPKSNKKSCTSWQDTTQLEPSHWWDGQEMGKENSIPPLYTGWTWPENCCPYYRTKFKNLAKTFVERHHGTIYRPILEKCEEELAKSSSNNILPAFYHTLNHLICQQKTEQHPFTLVFRTFGSDVREMAKLVTEFAQGKHPDYPDVNYPPLELFPDRLYQGRWEKMQNGLPVYQLWNEDETKLVASGDAEILKLLEQVSVCGIRDDYPFWKDNGWNPMAGKPVWIPSYNVHQEKYIGCYDHHLLFDDNIHNLRHDGIASVRKQLPDGTFETMDGVTMHESQCVHLIRVPTVEPVLNPNWYVEQIDQAKKRLQQRLAV